VLVHFFEQRFAKAVALQKMAELENGSFVRQTIQLQAGKVPHGFNFVEGVLDGWVAEIVEQLHAVDSQHGRQRIRRSASLALEVMLGYLLLQLLPGNQLVHPLRKDLAVTLALLGLVLGFGEGGLIHGGNESCSVDDGLIIADQFSLSLEFVKIKVTIQLTSATIIKIESHRYP